MVELIPETGAALFSVDQEQLNAVLVRGDDRWTISGVILEGAWAIGYELLVVTSDNIPYEDMLHIALLAPGGCVVEQLDLGGIYTTGSFEALGLDGRALRFRFFNEMDWRVEVLDTPRRRIPYLSDPKGVRRGLGLSTRLAISATPSS